MDPEDFTTFVARRRAIGVAQAERLIADWIIGYEPKKGPRRELVPTSGQQRCQPTSAARVK